MTQGEAERHPIACDYSVGRWRRIGGSAHAAAIRIGRVGQRRLRQIDFTLSNLKGPSADVLRRRVVIPDLTSVSGNGRFDFGSWLII